MNNLTYANSVEVTCYRIYDHWKICEFCLIKEQTNECNDQPPITIPIISIVYSYTDPSPSEERDGERKGKILKERELRSRGWGNRRDQPTVGEQMVQKYQTSKRGWFINRAIERVREREKGWRKETATSDRGSAFFHGALRSAVN